MPKVWEVLENINTRRRGLPQGLSYNADIPSRLSNYQGNPNSNFTERGVSPGNSAKTSEHPHFDTWMKPGMMETISLVLG